jgi:Ran GTPase-activating protein (RanGAP) involved in mRNA processing and transport
VVLRRGFPEVVEMEAADFLAHGGELLEHAPVRGVRLTRLVPSQVPALVAAPQLSLLTTLDLRNNGIGPEGARALAAAPQLSRLTTLELWGEGIGEEGARALASSPHLAHLIKLNLWGNGIGPEGARALAESPHLASLTALELRGNNIGARLLEQIERTVQQRRQAAQDGAAGGRWSGPTGTNPH